MMRAAVADSPRTFSVPIASSKAISCVGDAKSTVLLMLDPGLYNQAPHYLVKTDLKTEDLLRKSLSWYRIVRHNYVVQTIGNLFGAHTREAKKNTIVVEDAMKDALPPSLYWDEGEIIPIAKELTASYNTTSSVLREALPNIENNIQAIKARQKETDQLLEMARQREAQIQECLDILRSR